jgi:hypothetical protein
MYSSIQKSLFCPLGRLLLMALFGIVFLFGSSAAGNAQALGWEGETGVFVTPMAYTASAAGQKIHPVVAYHYFNAGSVIGDFHEISIEAGIGQRFELGYTREFHNFGGDPSLSPLWQDGFDIFNAKFIVVPENYKKHNWVPAISTGVIVRTGVRNVGDYLKWNPDTNNGSHNEDFYVVASKAIPVKNAGPLVAVVPNAGLRGTNAELWGMGGNAPDWQARGFGALAFVFKGPDKSTIIFGSEASQQPHHPLGFTSATDPGGVQLNIPTSLTYCARVVPSPKHKLNFDIGIAQVAGNIAPGVNLKARHQFGAQMSYGF